MTDKQLTTARENIAGFLKDCRINANLTQVKLAELSGIDKDTISRIERAKYWPVMRQIVLILTACGVDYRNVFKVK